VGGFFSTITENEFFAAGVGLFGVGLATGLLRTGIKQAGVFMRRQCFVTLEIPSKDKSYHWVLQWISARAAVNTRHLSVETSYQQFENGRTESRFDYVPSPGVHWIMYKNNLVRVQRDREKSAVDLQSGKPFETVTLTAVGRDRGFFTDLLQDARDMHTSRKEGKTVIFTNWGTEWRPFGSPRNRRPFGSVILPEGKAQLLLNDVREFIQSSSWYLERGIPYRRGYLLYGPPGSGKSSFITALAGELQYNICLLSISEHGMTDDRLNHALSIVPEQSIILLEDIDRAFVTLPEEHPAGKGFSSRVTFSGLLNALDGVAATERRIIFMTTNHINKLDAALIRPGRVDLKVYLGDADRSQVLQMFARFYGDDHPLADKFADALDQKGLSASMAMLQGHFMCYKMDPQTAIDHLDQLLKP